MVEWAEPLIQLGTAGGFGALVWFLVVKHIPNIESRHRTERDEWRKEYSVLSGKTEDLMREVVTALSQANSLMDRWSDK